MDPDSDVILLLFGMYAVTPHVTVGEFSILIRDLRYGLNDYKYNTGKKKKLVIKNDCCQNHVRVFTNINQLRRPQSSS